MNLAEPFQSLINISVEAYAFTMLQLCTPKISLFSEKKLKTFYSLHNYHTSHYTELRDSIDKTDVIT